MSITAQPLMTLAARPAADLEERTERRLRVAGVAVLLAAALGSVLGVAPAVSDTSSTDTRCRVDIVGSYWFSTGCSDEPPAPAAR